MATRYKYEQKNETQKYLPIFSSVTVPLLTLFFTLEIKAVANTRHLVRAHVLPRATLQNQNPQSIVFWLNVLSARGIPGEWHCMGNTYCVFVYSIYSNDIRGRPFLPVTCSTQRIKWLCRNVSMNSLIVTVNDVLPCNSCLYTCIAYHITGFYTRRRFGA